MATVDLVSIEKSPDAAEKVVVGETPDVTVKLLIRFPGAGAAATGGVPLSLTVPDQGDATKTLEMAREKLLALAEAMTAAAQHPLW